jgi:O-acetyl-ADP-ribose deacetylase (regulator of RNase III)
MKYQVKNIIKAAKDGDINILAHQANCFNLMGAGVAGAIAANFPEAAIADSYTPKGARTKLGSFSGYYLPDFDLTIYNLYGQYTPGHCGTSVHLEESIRRMVQDILSRTDQDIRIGIPKMGCGIAGGNWDEFSKMIEVALAPLSVNTTVFVLDESEVPK